VRPGLRTDQVVILFLFKPRTTIKITFFILHDTKELMLSQLESDKENPAGGGVYMRVSLIYELNLLLLNLHKLSAMF
jgi:hypothetical protein